MPAAGVGHADPRATGPTALSRRDTDPFGLRPAPLARALSSGPSGRGASVTLRDRLVTGRQRALCAPLARR
jgi:hypothetical protein